jgi:hypothetical protein
LERTQRRPVFGPKPAAWQQEKASAFRVRSILSHRWHGAEIQSHSAAGKLLLRIHPAQLVSDVALTTTRAAWLADTDFLCLMKN